MNNVVAQNASKPRAGPGQREISRKIELASAELCVIIKSCTHYDSKI